MMTGREHTLSRNLTQSKLMDTVLLTRMMMMMIGTGKIRTRQTANAAQCHLCRAPQWSMLSAVFCGSSCSMHSHVALSFSLRHLFLCLQKRNFYKDCNAEQKKQKMKQVHILSVVLHLMHLMCNVCVSNFCNCFVCRTHSTRRGKPDTTSMLGV
jgi:hypothetical protein